jgi:outer membrane lipoprotein carrier protein
MKHKKSFPARRSMVPGVLLVSLIFLAINTSSFGITVQKISDEVKNRFEKLKDFQSEILQTNMEAGKIHAITYSGHLYFQKPEKLRLDYNPPTEQVVVINEERIWIYSAELKQVTIQNIDEAAIPLPPIMIFGVAELSDEMLDKYYTKPVETKKMDERLIHHITLRPKKSGPGEFNFEFWVDGKTWLPYKISAYTTDDDSGSSGDHITIEFVDPQVDTGISGDKFTFQAADNIEIIDYTEPMNNR